MRRRRCPLARCMGFSPCVLSQERHFMDFIAQLDAFEAAALQAMQGAADDAALEKARIEFLGAKQGKLRDLQNLLGTAPKELKPVVGKRFNEVKNAVTAGHEQRKRSLSRPKHLAGTVDVTLPGTMP